MAQFYSQSMPYIVRGADGEDAGGRTLMKIPMKNSAALYLGAFISDIQGTQAAPTGPEFGVPSGYTAHNVIGGYVVGFTRKQGLLTLLEDSAAAGSVTNATGELPPKYTAAATNDESNTTSAILELVEIMPIKADDILSVVLFGAGATSVARGTTTAAGTTTSSDNIGVGLQVSTTYPFALLESSAAKSLSTTADCITVSLDGQKPSNSHRVFVKFLKTSSNWSATLA